MQLACYHVLKAFSLARRYDKTFEGLLPHFQNKMRKIVAARVDRIEAAMPERMKCPISKCIMRTPVLASDETTYELTQAVVFLKRQNPRDFPLQRGIMGRPMPNQYLTLNRAALEETHEFREQHNMTKPG